MPKRLLERCRPDSIREFRTAAVQRFNDALALAAGGNRTGAIYLFGYSAEMILKAAYFSRSRLDTDPLTMGIDIKPAIELGISLMIAWPVQGRGHNIRAWTELLVIERNTSPVTPNPALDREIHRNGQRIGQLWNETLRYRGNLAYRHEVRQVRESTEWFLVNSSIL